ncbi:MAG: type II toxin-antitoxin system HicA family toxin [Deltaproteobacteria bacterium]|nr:type II toxin-antitoxin system HicA family toxin [Deltaproteobacteria bacterium]
MKLNKRQRKTIEKIYEKPTRADIAWTDILTLFRACGAQMVQREGSRVCIKLGSQRAVFHAPHPHKETVKGAIEDLREFLKNAGIFPEGRE